MRQLSCPDIVSVKFLLVSSILSYSVTTMEIVLSYVLFLQWKYLGFRCFDWMKLAPARRQCVVLWYKYRPQPRQKSGGYSAYTPRSPEIADVPQRPIAAAAWNGISDVITDLEKRHIISRSPSPYNSPVWPVQKLDGRWCLTIDYQHNNILSYIVMPTHIR